MAIPAVDNSASQKADYKAVELVAQTVVWWALSKVVW